MGVGDNGLDTALNTFGAVLRFAIDMEERLSRLYGEMAVATRNEQVASLLTDLASAHGRRSQEVARIRRENVAEMILEPVVGMDAAKYLRDLSPAGNVSDSDRLRIASLVEGDAEGFYRDAASSLSIAEVSRLLKRLARESAGSRSRVEALASQ